MLRSLQQESLNRKLSMKNDPEQKHSKRLFILVQEGKKMCYKKSAANSSVIRTQTEKTLNGKMMLLKIEHWKKFQYITNQNFCWGKCYLNQIPDFHTPLMYRIIHRLYSTPISWFMKQLWFQWAYSVYQFWETKQQQQQRAEKKISHSFALGKILSVDEKH